MSSRIRGAAAFGGIGLVVVGLILLLPVVGALAIVHIWPQYGPDFWWWVLLLFVMFTAIGGVGEKA